MKVIILGLLLFFVGCASERQISDAKYEQYQYDRQHFTTDDLVGEKSSRGKEMTPESNEEVNGRIK